MTVIEYVTEEVSRQGHDVLVLDGIERVGWMLNAWAYALTLGELSAGRIQKLGMDIEPQKNAGGFRTRNVRVGGRRCPDWQEAPDLVRRLLENGDALTPLEWYKEFEEIHPFVDGNGRTGKILLNWLNETLLDPVFPPNDLWGDPIRNP